MGKERLAFKVSIILALTLSMTSCRETVTTNPAKVYKLWSGKKASKGIRIIHGRYWESAHWTKEYMVFMELEVSKSWINEFAVGNNLTPDTSGTEIADAPEWFRPDTGYLAFRRKDDPYGSKYYVNVRENKAFIFEVQL